MTSGKSLSTHQLLSFCVCEVKSRILAAENCVWLGIYSTETILCDGDWRDCSSSFYKLKTLERKPPTPLFRTLSIFVQCLREILKVYSNFLLVPGQTPLWHLVTPVAADPAKHSAVTARVWGCWRTLIHPLTSERVCAVLEHLLFSFSRTVLASDGREHPQEPAGHPRLFSRWKRVSFRIPHQHLWGRARPEVPVQQLQQHPEESPADAVRAPVLLCLPHLDRSVRPGLSRGHCQRHARGCSVPGAGLCHRAQGWVCGSLALLSFPWMAGFSVVDCRILSASSLFPPWKSGGWIMGPDSVFLSVT